MLHVGILSMQNVNNYGSFWQASSLGKMIKEIGCEVGYINIRPGRQIVDITYHKSFSIGKIRRIPYYVYSHKRSAMYERVKSEAFVTRGENDYDAVVIGSDEVFNCRQESPWGFSTQLYGDVDCKKVFSYAASFGSTEYSFIKDKGIETEMRDAMSRLSDISVRDENSKQIIKTVANRECEIHLDPVLLNMDFVSENESKMVLKQKYLLVYSYDFRLKEKEYICAIKKYAEDNHLMTVAAGFYQDWVDKNIIATPYEIIGLFKNAQCVVTDTFHGTIFSIKCHRKFATIVRDSNRQKLGDLLKRLYLQDHLVDSFDRINGILSIQPDYCKIDELLEHERQRSLNYLRKALCVN